MSTAGLMEPDVARKVGGGKKQHVDYVHPAPEVPARDMQAGDPSLPLAVVRAEKLALSCGWHVHISYSRGATSSLKGRAGALVHAYGVAFLRGTQRVAAVWRTPVEGKLAWKFDFAAVLGVVLEPAGVSPLPYLLSADELKGLLRAEAITRWPVADCQYEQLPDGKRGSLIAESAFRALVNPPKKEIPGA